MAVHVDPKVRSLSLHDELYSLLRILISKPLAQGLKSVEVART